MSIQSYIRCYDKKTGLGTDFIGVFTMNESPIYFISDAHLGAEDYVSEKPRRHHFLNFLRSLRGKTNQLYIVGDLFDFWLDYQSVIPRQHYTVLYELNVLVENGTQITYISGNHDFSLGTFLDQQVGLKTSHVPLTVNHQGRRIFLAHGHGLGPGDLSYKILSKILYNRFFINSFRIIHPDLGFILGRLFSRLSRTHTKPTTIDPNENHRELVFSLFNEGYDIVVLGHSHRPALWDKDGKVYINLGDWLQHYTYGVLRNGRMTLEKYENDTTMP